MILDYLHEKSRSWPLLPTNYMPISSQRGTQSTGKSGQLHTTNLYRISMNSSLRPTVILRI